MSQLTVTKPAVETKTCADCPYFDDFQESSGRGWCGLFNHYCRSHHEQTGNCVNSSDLEVTHELEDNLEFFPNLGLDAFPNEEIEDEADLPYTEYEVGSIVKVIDRDERYEEWGVFEVIECKHHKSLYRHTESCLTEASWFLRHLLNGGNPRNAVSRFFRLSKP